MSDKPQQPGRRQALVSTSLLLGAGLVPISARASHHFEGAASRANPKIGLTDLYVFKAPGADKTIFILNCNFMPERNQDLLDPAALYSIHCATDEAFKSGMTWSFGLEGKQFVLHQLDQPNAAPGSKGKELGRFGEASETRLPGGLRAWVGLAKDPFFGNSPGLHVFRGQLAQGKYDPQVWEKASGKNIFQGRTCASLVLEVPNQSLGKQIKVFSTSAVQMGGQWQQEQYMARPLVAHTMLFEDDVLKTAYDRSRPDTQGQFQNFFAARIARSAHFARSQSDVFAYGDQTAKGLLPDVIPYQVGSEATFSAARVNGRKLGDDAMSATLTLLIGQPTDQHLKDSRYYTDKFPFVVLA